MDNDKARIFTARIRLVETATTAVGANGEDDDDDGEDDVRTDVRLEDPKTGDLFANCPYEVAAPPLPSVPHSLRCYCAVAGSS